MGVSENMGALVAAEEYAAEQERLGELMRQGFLSLARSRLHVGRGWSGPEDCRTEIEPTVTLVTERPLAAEQPSVVLRETRGSSDPGLLFTCLTHPEYRVAQRRFKEGLEAVVRMANRAEKVLEVAQSAPGSVAGEAGQDAEETE